jgi:hypothetical protein
MKTPRETTTFMGNRLRRGDNHVSLGGEVRLCLNRGDGFGSLCPTNPLTVH